MLKGHTTENQFNFNVWNFCVMNFHNCKQAGMVYGNLSGTICSGIRMINNDHPWLMATAVKTIMLNLAMSIQDALDSLLFCLNSKTLDGTTLSQIHSNSINHSIGIVYLLSNKYPLLFQKEISSIRPCN